MTADSTADIADADIAFMARALQLARRGLYSTDPNPRVGCLVVRDDRVIGQGWHKRAGDPHAEVHALAQAGTAAHGATAYVTLEPCCHHGLTPPCTDALIRAGVARVVVAMKDSNPQVAGQGLARLEAAGIRTRVGVLQAEAEALNPGFLRRMDGGAPWVRLKLAASMDGRTAMASGESQWITGRAARADVQRLRARSSAIITGIGTVLADDPSLTVRPGEMGPLGETTEPQRQPLRIVLDSDLRTPPGARVVTGPGRVVLLCRKDVGVSQQRERLESVGAEVVPLLEGGDRGRSWALVQEWLRSQPLNEVLIEAGAEVAGSALAAALVDELWLYQAPTLLGSAGRPMALLPLERMAQQLRMKLVDQRRIGEDTRTLFTFSGSRSGT